MAIGAASIGGTPRLLNSLKEEHWFETVMVGKNIQFYLFFELANAHELGRKRNRIWKASISRK